MRWARIKGVTMTHSPVDYKPFQRSELKSMPPVECASGLVESLSCYVERLSIVIDVPRKHLELFVDGKPILTRGRGGRPHSLSEMVRADSPLRRSAAFAARLAELTHQPEVARLGLGWMCDVVTVQEAIKKHCAWCPRCLKDSLQGRRPAYVPLLWSIKAVEVCPLHGVPLRSSCAHCGTAFPMRAGLRYPFHSCSKCFLPLGQTSSDSKPGGGRAAPEQRAAAESVQEMFRLLRSRPPGAELRKPDLRRVIESATARGVCAGTEHFLRIAHISKGTFSGLIHGAKGSLDLWVRVALAADVSLAGLFAPELWAENVRGESISWLRRLTPIRRWRSLDWDDIRQQVTAQIESGNAESFNAFSARLGVDAAHLRRVLGRRLVDRFNKAAAAKRDRESSAEVLALAAQLVKETSSMVDRGVRPSARALARRLSRGRQSSIFVAALRIARERLSKAR
jgi:hypothetical protein